MKKHLSVFLIAALLAAGSSAVHSQSAAPPQRAARQVLAPDRLGRVETTLQQYVDQNLIAGAVVLVLQDGKPALERAVGWSDREARRPMKTDTIFRIASQTKALTSAAILILMEEGKLGVADPVSRYIPSFAKSTVSERTASGVATVPARRAVTIRDLLTHTAGLSYGTQNEIAPLYEEKGLGPAAGFGWYTADKDEPICETMERLGTLPLIAHPGERYVYGYNTDVLGCIVERASGMPLDEFIRTRITGPLGMTDTHFYLPPGQRERLAAVYASGDAGTIVRAPEGPKGQGSYIEGPRRSFSGGAGLLSTARDYARFLEMTRNGGQLNGARILSPRSVQLMTTNQSGTLHSTAGLGYGFGFQTTDQFGANGLDSAGAYGWSGAYGTMYRVDPEARVVIVLMIQLIPNTTDIRFKVPTLVYQALQ